ncbi:hypothetical protein PIB30_007643 [Stylosanthes scabra]|uniref:Uncharacterized protein n=1 Tax=Stylosanthes scabra TaxID=79078 RepID=A0ABU6V3Q2_9FABA|nr:hypothetical protein [Stylosanthes scabra]
MKEIVQECVENDLRREAAARAGGNVVGIDKKVEGKRLGGKSTNDGRVKMEDAGSGRCQPLEDVGGGWGWLAEELDWELGNMFGFCNCNAVARAQGAVSEYHTAS